MCSVYRCRFDYEEIIAVKVDSATFKCISPKSTPVPTALTPETAQRSFSVGFTADNGRTWAASSAQFTYYLMPSIKGMLLIESECCI